MALLASSPNNEFRSMDGLLDRIYSSRVSSGEITC